MPEGGGERSFRDIVEAGERRSRRPRAGGDPIAPVAGGDPIIRIVRAGRQLGKLGPRLRGGDSNAARLLTSQ